MRKFSKFLLVLIMAFFIVAPQAHAVMQDMWANVYSWDGSESVDGKPVLTLVTSGITYKVLAIDSDTAETLYVFNSDAYTSLTNPITTTVFATDATGMDKVAFRVDPTDANNDRYVDLIVVDTAGGYTKFVENFDKYQHTIVIDERPGIMHHGIIWFAATSTSETDTGIDFDYDTAVHKVIVEIVTAHAGSTDYLSVGTNSSATVPAEAAAEAGFVVDAAVATAGYVVQSAANMGTFLDDGTNNLVHVINGSVDPNLIYSASPAAGYIHFFFTRLR